MTVNQMLSAISSEELTELEAYFIIKEEDQKLANLACESQIGAKQRYRKR
jgi:hypothetical protein